MKRKTIQISAKNIRECVLVTHVVDIHRQEKQNIIS